MKVPSFISSGIVASLFVALACGEEHDPIDTTKNPIDASGQFLLDAPIRIDAQCFVEINTVPIPPVTHVPIGTEIIYNSNPPAGGPHYPIWAGYQEYEQPVDRRYWVHNLEHGAVALLYKCSAGDGCPQIREALRSVAATIAEDPLCTPLGLRHRIVITPDPLLDVPIAAASWGWTYRAECIDVPSLVAFASEHYGKGTEITCAQGQTQF